MNVYLVIFFQQLIASGTHLVAKTVTHNIDPLILTFLRGVISAVALVFIFFIKEKRIKIERKDLPLLFWLSLIAIPINQFLYLYGIKFTLAANGALLYGTTPVFVLVLSRIILKEKMTRAKIFGVLIAFSGVCIVVFERGIDFSSDYFFGNIMIFLAVLAWALYAVQGKRLIKKYGAFYISALTLIIGALMFVPIGMFGLSTFDITAVSQNDWYGILYLALGTSVVGYLLWYYAIGKFDTTKVAVFQNAQPILTALMGFVFLHQGISLNFVFGGVITIVGVLLTQKK